MARPRVYYLDVELTPHESAGGRFRAAARRRGQPGWVFRFDRIDEHAEVALLNLNDQARSARIIAEADAA